MMPDDFAFAAPAQDNARPQPEDSRPSQGQQQPGMFQFDDGPEKPLPSHGPVTDGVPTGDGQPNAQPNDGGLDPEIIGQLFGGVPIQQPANPQGEQQGEQGGDTFDNWQERAAHFQSQYDQLQQQVGGWVPFVEYMEQYPDVQEAVLGLFRSHLQGGQVPTVQGSTGQPHHSAGQPRNPNGRFASQAGVQGGQATQNGVASVQNGQLTAPPKPVKPADFSHIEATSDPDSESAKWLFEELPAWQERMTEYNEELLARQQQALAQVQQQQFKQMRNQSIISQVMARGYSREQAEQFVQWADNPQTDIDTLLKLHALQTGDEAKALQEARQEQLRKREKNLQQPASAAKVTSQDRVPRRSPVDQMMDMMLDQDRGLLAFAQPAGTGQHR